MSSFCSHKQPRGEQVLKHNVDIAIIGAGFSGSLLAIQILRKNARARVFLVEKALQFGRGLAYGAADPQHLLNVRASNMSAFPEEPDHFIDWLRANAPQGVEPRSFVSRQLFGTYLQTMLRAIVETGAGAGRLVTVPDEAVSVTLDGARPRVRLALGRSLYVEQVVLATGNLPPHDQHCFIGAAGASLYLSDPWSSEACRKLGPTDEILLLGTGLTAVDMILRLRAMGYRGLIRALSRRGLRPHRHADHGPTAAVFPVSPQPSLSALLRLIRSQARLRGWREAVDGLRPSVQRLWCEASDVERKRFLRHLRPWWDVHRHRLAPAIADSVQAFESGGNLTFSAGRIEQVSFSDDHADVTWIPRGTQTMRNMRVGRIINCTGPAGDLTKAKSPLLRDLLLRGLARPDFCNLGLDVDPYCRVIDVDGKVQTQLLAVGPLSRGAFWEITAVPDIRVQAAQVAKQLASM